ncbi:MAG: (2Fe-2S)-binding protein [Gemmatimonadales bacterium]|nr:MAG: (2Fe-2S)-binding protein [Gemmatimonadales bacterium]
MSERYRAVGWTRHKRFYDAAVLAGACTVLGIFAAATVALEPDATPETILIRGLGLVAIVLLHVILVIGPLSRLDPRFLPLLYNRRHLGVTTFAFALAHGLFAIIQFHALGDVHPLVSVLTGDGEYTALTRFPFQPLGLAALGILFLLAATSHDFWLANLTAPVWKAMHMLVYVAYALVIGHVAFGALQAEAQPVLAVLLGVGMVGVVGLHLAAAVRERRVDRDIRSIMSDGYVDVCAAGEIPENRARVFAIGGERVAVFRYDGKFSCVSNVCQHQNGPLGEGRIIDGCITCPWHGYQYYPESGQSPPPFMERIPTFNVRVIGQRVLVDPHPSPPGTPVVPATFPKS